MINSLPVTFISIFILILSASAEVTLPQQERFSGDKAYDEIQDLMKKRWYRQAWQIEHKIFAGFASWHIKGSLWWVKLDGPKHLLKMLDLSKLDKEKVYEFVGVPVDQNYGTITFYVLSSPKVIATTKSNNAERGVSPQSATQSR